MKILLYALGALIVIGAIKGTGSVEFGNGKNAALEIATSVLTGVRDMTVYLIPNIVEWFKHLVDTIPSTNSHPS